MKPRLIILTMVLAVCTHVVAQTTPAPRTDNRNAPATPPLAGSGPLLRTDAKPKNPAATQVSIIAQATKLLGQGEGLSSPQDRQNIRKAGDMYNDASQLSVEIVQRSELQYSTDEKTLQRIEKTQESTRDAQAGLGSVVADTKQAAIADQQALNEAVAKARASNDPFDKAEARRQFQAAKDSEAQAKQFAALAAAASAPAAITSARISALQRRMKAAQAQKQLHTILATSFRNSAAGLHAIADEMDAFPNQGSIDITELTSVYLKGPDLTPAEEKEFEAMMNTGMQVSETQTDATTVRR